MALDTTLRGSVSGVGADVDANKHLMVTPTLVDTDAGFVVALGENDAGTITGTRDVRAVETSEDFRQRAGIDQVLMTEWFGAGAINSALFASPATTMTIALSGGYLTLNSGTSTASGAVARVSSYRTFSLQGGSGLSFRCRAQLAFAPVANNVTEWGLFFASGTTAPTDGAFFRYNAAGELRCVINRNGTEAQSAVLDASALIGTNTTRNFAIDLHESAANFWINDVLVASFANDSGIGPVASGALPICFRSYNTAITSSAQQLRVAFVSVLQADAALQLPPQVAACGAGLTGHQGQTGQTMGSTAFFANSSNPTAAVPTNTTAALGSGLGGQFWETDTLAVTTDGIISSHQVPAGAVSAPGKTLYISGVRIESFVQSALTGGGYNAVWSLAFGHTAVSLATSEASASGTKAPRRVALGQQSVASGAAALTSLGVIQQTFQNPIPVNAGEFVQTVRKKVGTAPSAGVIAHLITFDAFYA